MVAKTYTKTERKNQRKEELREKLKGLEYLRQIDNAVNAVVDAKFPPSPEDLAAKKFIVDTNFKRLAKILPDLKQTDLEIQGGLTLSSHEEWLATLSSTEDDD